MTQTKQAVSNFGGERWEEVPRGDAQGSSGWLGRRPGACALRSSFWKRKSKRSLRAPQLQCLGTSTEKSQDTPCSGAVPAQRPALGAEALFWFGGLGLRAGGASPRCGRVPSLWPCPQAVAFTAWLGRALGFRAVLLPCALLGADLLKARRCLGFPALTPCKAVGAARWHPPATRHQIASLGHPNPAVPANEMPFREEGGLRWVVLCCFLSVQSLDAFCKRQNPGVPRSHPSAGTRQRHRQSPARRRLGELGARPRGYALNSFPL